MSVKESVKGFSTKEVKYQKYYNIQKKWAKTIQ